MHSHHSHSGQFCQHAKNALEDMIICAIAKGLKLLCLTEHMPRIDARHLYPEELASNTSVNDLAATFDSYFKSAREMQVKYADKIDILVGFEGEGISHEYLRVMEELVLKYQPDMFIGSVHHSGDLPLDYDQGLWNQALTQAGSLESMYATYFQRLEEVISRLRPPVLAHFDLIRLYSPEFDLSRSSVWPLVQSAVQAGVREGCLFEVNSAALRKGWNEPYPRRDVAELIVASGGKFCLSDDAHTVEQVALNYEKVLGYLRSLKVSTLYRLGLVDKKVETIPVSVEEFEQWIKDNGYL